jgi:Cap4 SAVED domain
LTVYDTKPDRFLKDLHRKEAPDLAEGIYCAGFEFDNWRCVPFANHLIEWLPEYALPEDELSVTHGNMYVKLQQAAVRVYTSPKYKQRGEAGEIALHAICRDFFGTIPISSRVFYKSASNDVIKAFDLVHARFPTNDSLEIWLGESKLYDNASQAIADAISSVRAHIEQGFLQNQKLLLGPQIPRSTPHYEEINAIFKSQTSIDTLLSSSVFVIGIFCNSDAAIATKKWNDGYVDAVRSELEKLSTKIAESTLPTKIRMLLVYVPLGSKTCLVDAFDTKLKGLQ